MIEPDDDGAAMALLLFVVVFGWASWLAIQ